MQSFYIDQIGHLRVGLPAKQLIPVLLTQQQPVPVVLTQSVVLQSQQPVQLSPLALAPPPARTLAQAPAPTFEQAPVLQLTGQAGIELRQVIERTLPLLGTPELRQLAGFIHAELNERSKRHERQLEQLAPPIGHSPLSNMAQQTHSVPNTHPYLEQLGPQQHQQVNQQLTHVPLVKKELPPATSLAPRAHAATLVPVSVSNHPPKNVNLEKNANANLSVADYLDQHGAEVFPSSKNKLTVRNLCLMLYYSLTGQVLTNGSRGADKNRELIQNITSMEGKVIEIFGSNNNGLAPNVKKSFNFWLRHKLIDLLAKKGAPCPEKNEVNAANAAKISDWCRTLFFKPKPKRDVQATMAKLFGREMDHNYLSWIGDFTLWDLLKKKLANVGMPQNQDALTALLKKEFFELTGLSIDSCDMSQSDNKIKQPICVKVWREQIFPDILNRFKTR